MSISGQLPFKIQFTKTSQMNILLLLVVSLGSVRDAGTYLSDIKLFFIDVNLFLVNSSRPASLSSTPF